MTFARNVAWACACALFCAAVPPLSAHEVPVPMDVQIALFAKIWKLDRTFKPGTPIELAVLYQQEYRPSANAAQEFLAAVKAARLPIHVTLIDLNEQDTVRQRVPTKGFDVLYLTPLRAIDVGTIAGISRRHGIRTITGVPEYVASGVAVGIGLLKQRPLIIINLRAARSEGSEFAARLLKLARVIEEGGTAYVGEAGE